MSQKDLFQNYMEEDVILLGETHTEDAHTKLEEEAIYRTVPRYILSEGLDDSDPDIFDESIEGAYKTSLRGLQNYFNEVLDENEGLTAESTRELYEVVQDVDESDYISHNAGDIPESYNEFMDTPFFRMHEGAIDAIADSIERRAEQEADEYGKWMDEESTDSMIDEETGRFYDLKLRSLYNAMGKVREFSYKINESQGSLMKAASDLRKEGFDVDLAGCDVNKRERYQDNSDRHFDATPSNMDEAERQIQEIKDNPEKAAEDFIKDMQFIAKATDESEIQARDTKMAERIEHFHNKNDSGRAVLAVLGANHLEGVEQKLEEEGVSVYTENLNEVVRNEKDSDEGLMYAFRTADNLRN